MSAETSAAVVRAHQGDLGGLPPTVQRVVMTGMEFSSLADGLITERWSNSDTLGLLQQLGVVSPE